MERETRARRRRDRGARGAYKTIREHAPQVPVADRDLYRAPGDPVYSRGSDVYVIVTDSPKVLRKIGSMTPVVV
jgi:hypothetical protein